MERLYTWIITTLDTALTWMDTHRDLGGRYLAPTAAVVSFMVGFWFLLRSLGII